MLELIEIIVYRGQDVFSEHPVKNRNFGARIRQICWNFSLHTQGRCCETFLLLSFSDISLLTSLGVNLYQML